MGNHSEANGIAPGTDDLLPTRRTLLHRLKNWSDQASWQEFFDTYWRLIYRVGIKSGLSDSEAEEVVQETVISVAKAMRDFQYDPKRGSFKGWLRQLTGWRIINQVRKRSGAPADRPGNTMDAESEPDGPALSAGFQVAPELERLWEAEWEENLLQTAMDRVRGQARPKHFQIFDLYVVKHKPVKDVCQFLGVSATEVYLAKHRVGRLVRKEVTRLREKLL